MEAAFFVRLVHIKSFIVALDGFLDDWHNFLLNFSHFMAGCVGFHRVHPFIAARIGLFYLLLPDLNRVTKLIQGRLGSVFDEEFFSIACF